MATVASFLKPYPLRAADCLSHVSAVAESLAAFGISVRAAIDQADSFGDVATSDVFTELAQGVDQLLWLAEACEIAFRAFPR
jgi:DNA-binding ferritin-like protein